jgi:DNA polymerase
LRCEESDIYTPILTVHDELIVEAPLGAGSVREFEALVAECPPWATNCPVAAEGFVTLRYYKP